MLTLQEVFDYSATRLRSMNKSWNEELQMCVYRLENYDGEIVNACIGGYWIVRYEISYENAGFKALGSLEKMKEITGGMIDTPDKLQLMSRLQSIHDTTDLKADETYNNSLESKLEELARKYGFKYTPAPQPPIKTQTFARLEDWYPKR